MALPVTIIPTTTSISILPATLVAKGNALYDAGYGMDGLVNISMGFVYSTSPIILNMTNDVYTTDSISVSPTGVGSVESSTTYPGGDIAASANINVDYVLNIEGLTPNTTYYVRSYVKYYKLPGPDPNPIYKYGRQLSALSGALSLKKGYYISPDIVGFYDPLQVRDTNEGVERILTSDSSGLATWKPVKSLFSFGHYIGELYGGGIVVAVWKEGDDEKVLIASKEDIVYDLPGFGGTFQTADIPWSYGVAQTSLIGSSAQNNYNGYLNTAAIVAQATSLGTIYSAADACAKYRSGGYEDWYLPSYYELNQIYNQSAIVNQVLQSDSGSGVLNASGKSGLNFIALNYWSSTEAYAGQAIAFNSSFDNGYLAIAKSTSARVRAVRKESAYTGDGLIFNLDSTKMKSFSDIEYLNLGTASRWRDLVNGGMTSSYAFPPTNTSTAVGGTTTDLLALLTTIGIPTNIENLGYRQVGDWWIDKVGGTSTPLMNNRGGASSLTSVYFTVPADGRLSLIFDCYDGSTIKDPSKSTINIYVSTRYSTYTGSYIQVSQISDLTGSVSNRTISLNSFVGKTISVRMTAPNAFYNSSTDLGGVAIDNIAMRAVSGGYQPTGPVYFPEESGFIRFNGTYSVSNATWAGSYYDIKAPIGTTNTVTVEMWVRLLPGYEDKMLFGWNIYCIYTQGGALGFNTGNGELFGISSAQLRGQNTIGKWAHYVFVMRSDISYSIGNSIFINGNEQTLAQVNAGTGENALQRNFNSGLGRIGGRRFDEKYLFRGDISVVRIYNRPLSKDEIMANYGNEKKRYDIVPVLLTNSLFASIDFDNPASFAGDGSVTREVVDLSGNSRNANLIISGTTQIPSVTRTNTLYNGKELVFPGTVAANPYLEWASSAAINGLQNLSVSFWIKITRHLTSEIIVKWNQSNAAVGSWEVFQSSAAGSNSNIAFRVRNLDAVNTYTFIGTKSIPLNTWTHVCATYDNSAKSAKTYINSSIDISSSVPQSFTIAGGNDGPIGVGRYPVPSGGSSYPLAGSIANIQIYSKVLSFGEIKNNYDAAKFEFEKDYSDSNKFYSHEINTSPTFSVSQNFRLNIGGDTNEKVMKLDQQGFAKWVDKSSLFTRPTNYRYIGELYGGGIIVAMWYYPKTIFNYLIMSIEDVSASSAWSNITSSSVPGTDPSSPPLWDFKGETNTSLIVAQPSHTTSAALLCKNYRGGGYADWYLPSAFEMNHAYNAASIVDTALGSDALVGRYWTSTEISSTSAYSYSFSSLSALDYTPSIGRQRVSPKTEANKVRAFRIATNAVTTNPWDTTWDETYTPWWGRSWDRNMYLEMDFMPASYTSFDFDYRRRTTVTTGGLSYLSSRGTFPNVDSTYRVSRSTVATYDRVIEFGICYSNSPIPTTADSKVIATGNYSIFDSEVIDRMSYGIYIRAYAITNRGTFYGTETNTAN